MVAARGINSRPISDCGDGKRFLVACHELIVAGGLYRFERFGHIIQKIGHHLAFVAFGEMPLRVRETEFPVLSFEEASRMTWDVTIVPGAGFPESTIRRFADLTSPSFGLRVQHVLNDQTRKSGFLNVNRVFEPDVVVFNNRHWKPGEFIEFQADAFYFLEGAVDIERFAPNPERYARPHCNPFVVGGLANKNVNPLLDAARLCGDVHLHLFGHPGDLAIHARDLLDEGRLQLLGVLDEDELATFYAGLDCVVHTETFAGWANLAAEGMACGVPVICTPHGTGAFADHETTALLVSNPTPHEFAEAIQRLRNDPHLAAHLARNARQRILPFSWTSYSAALLRLMRPQDTKYYSWSPERGLFGKWPEVARLAGLEPLLAKCDRKSVLDLGAAEGVIARNFLDHGATLVHGFEREPSRVRLAASICDNTSRAQFWEADLSDWDDFEAAHCSNLRDLYDIVLYLGLHQHLPAEKRMRALAGAATRSSHWLAIRMPTALFAADGVEQFLADRRFVCVNGHAKDKLTALGASYLFRYCN